MHGSAPATFGHREYTGNGYGKGVEEAWWCCTQNAGFVMCEVARHAVQLSADGKTIRINFPFPGTYVFAHDGRRIEVTVKSAYPAEYAAEVRVNGAADDAKVIFRIPYYVRNGAVTHEDGIRRLKGDIGHYLEERRGGWVVKYGPLMLAPMVYSWETFNSTDKVPAGYIPPTVDGSKLVIAKDIPTDSNGFLKLATGRQYVPTWPDYDDGAISRTGTNFRAPAVVPLVDGTGNRKELYFHPLCSQTSATVMRYVPIVFAREY